MGFIGATLSRRLDVKGDASTTPDGDSDLGGDQFLGLSVEPTVILGGRSQAEKLFMVLGIPWRNTAITLLGLLANLRDFLPMAGASLNAGRRILSDC